MNIWTWVTLGHARVQEWLIADSWRSLKDELLDKGLPIPNALRHKRKRAWSTILALLMRLVVPCIVANVLAIWFLYPYLSGGPGTMHGWLAAIVRDNLADIHGVDSVQTGRLGARDAMEEEANRDFEEQEHTYWRSLRSSLLTSHGGQWVAVVGGKVVSEGDRMSTVAARAYETTGHSVMYVAQVGREDSPYRLLTAVSSQTGMGHKGIYEIKETNRPKYPMIKLPMRGVSQPLSTNGSFLVDTGADISAVTPAAAAILKLRLSPVGRMRITGWSGASSVRQLFLMIIRVASKDVFTTVDAEAELCVLGRDVLNDFRLTASAKEGLLQLHVAPEDGSTGSPALPDPGHDSQGWWATEEELDQDTSGSASSITTSPMLSWMTPTLACASCFGVYAVGGGPLLEAVSKFFGL